MITQPPIKLTDEQVGIQESAREFAQKEVLPQAQDLDQKRDISTDLLKRAGDLGFLRMETPEAAGGLGLGMVELALVGEEIAKAAPGVAMAITSAMTMPPMLLAFPKCQPYLEDVLNGDKRVSISTTDPAGSTNYSEWSVLAKRDGDEWILNGSKNFSTNQGADICLVAGYCDDGKVRLFCTFKNDPGVNNTSHERMIGFGGGRFGTPTWTNCRVADDMCFEFDLPNQHAAFIGPFLNISTVALGAAEGAFEKTADYLQKRTRNGKPLMSLQTVAHRMAKNLAKIEVCKTMVYTVCQALDEQRAVPERANMTKAFVTETAVEVCKDCVQLFGGLGVCEDTGIDRYLRDALMTTIADYPSEQHYQTVAWYEGWQEEYGV